MGLDRAVARTTIAIIIAIAVIAFAIGFLTRTSSQMPVTFTARETVTTTSRQIITQTVPGGQTVTQAQVMTISTTITGVSVSTVVSTTYATTTSIQTVRQTETVTRISTVVSTVTQAGGLPQGATPLPFSGKTVFALIATGLNFNGSSSGGLVIYIPAGWGVGITFTNSHTIPHSIALVRNNTATPQSSNIGSDGTVIASQPAQPPGSMVQLIVDSVPEGVYWIACGVPGHARAGMWIILVSSPNVSTPYAIATQSSSSEYPYSYYGSTALLVLAALLSMIPVSIIAITKNKGQRQEL